MGKHSISRVKERYNMNLSYKDEHNILTMIKNGRALHLNLPTEDENMHFVYVLYKNIPLKILYVEHEDTGKVKGIVTVYPLDVDEYNEVTSEDLEDRIQMAKEFLQENKYVVYKRRF